MTEKNKTSLDAYPGLNSVSYAIAYLENLLAIVSEPLLIAAAVIATVDFLTGSALLRLPWIMFGWATSIAVAVSACFIVTFRRAFRAFSVNNYVAAVLLCILGATLGIADWAAVDTQSLQQTLNLTNIAALAQLNLNVVLITHVRSAVAISMSVVVAVSNHTAITTAVAPKRRLAFLDSLLDKIAPVVDSGPTQVTTITEASQPEVKRLPEAQAQGSNEQAPGGITQSPQDYASLVAQAMNSSNLTAAERVQAVLDSEPACSDARLARLANVSRTTAKKYRAAVAQDEPSASEILSSLLQVIRPEPSSGKEPDTIASNNSVETSREDEALDV